MENDQYLDRLILNRLCYGILLFNNSSKKVEFLNKACTELDKAVKGFITYKFEKKGDEVFRENLEIPLEYMFEYDEKFRGFAFPIKENHNDINMSLIIRARGLEKMKRKNAKSMKLLTNYIKAENMFYRHSSADGKKYLYDVKPIEKYLIELSDLVKKE